jgi:membrane-bound lytic murein transglycosylase A
MPLGARTTAGDVSPLRFEPIGFADLPGWAGDDHLSAFAAFLRSSGPVIDNAANAAVSGRIPPSHGLLEACRLALASRDEVRSGAEARAFFERYFAPSRIRHDGPDGLLTGYYEPVLEGALSPGGRFRVPAYRRPPELVNMVPEAQRATVGQAFTHMCRTANGLVPFATRAEIEAGALAGRGLELLWLASEVDAFFMHIQGSGQIRFANGSTVRVTYDGKNGHPYTSIGRYLIDSGQFPADRMSLDALKEWLEQDRARGRKVMQVNASFVFFRELSGLEGDGPVGVMHIPLSEGRSLAVDTAFHAIGLPIYVSSPSLTHVGTRQGLHRLMIAQDVGSAIRGPERGDIYFGSGDEAGRRAGITKHPGAFTVLLPRGRP